MGLRDGTKEWLETQGPKVKVVQRQWDDSFARQYNRFVQEISEGWLLILDDDEVPSADMLKIMREVVADLIIGGRKYDMIEFKSHPIEIDKDNKIVNNNGPVNYYRFLLHRYNPGMKYVIDLHQNLVGHKYRSPLRREETYYHIKTAEDGYRNSSRNWWIAGVWLPNDTIGYKPPEWHEFNTLVKSVYPHINVFSDFNAILVKGNMDERIKDYLYKIKDIPDRAAQ